MYRIDVLRITLTTTFVLVILSLSIDVSSANSQCKIAFMHYFAKRCMFNTKTKREVEKFDLDKLDYKRGKLGKTDVPEPVDPESRKILEKRHFILEKDAQTTSPIAFEDIRSVLEVNEQSDPRERHYEIGHLPDLEAAQYALKVSEFTDLTTQLHENGRERRLPLTRFERSSGRYPRESHQGPRIVSSLRSSTWEDILGFGLNADELDELYNDNAGRLPRNFDDETLARLKHAATKCCQNLEACKKDPNYIPCNKI